MAIGCQLFLCSNSALLLRQQFFHIPASPLFHTSLSLHAPSPQLLAPHRSNAGEQAGGEPGLRAWERMGLRTEWAQGKGGADGQPLPAVGLPAPRRAGPARPVRQQRARGAGAAAPYLLLVRHPVLEVGHFGSSGPGPAPRGARREFRTGRRSQGWTGSALRAILAAGRRRAAAILEMGMLGRAEPAGPRGWSRSGSSGLLSGG